MKICIWGNPGSPHVEFYARKQVVYSNKYKKNKYYPYQLKCAQYNYPKNKYEDTEIPFN